MSERPTFRQYIGARYVPMFDGDWDIRKSYQPLTIVKYQNNNWYTSKKVVPPGTDILNSEYWVLTGNLNGAIDELTEQVSDLRDDVEDLDDSVDSLETDVGSLNTRVNRLSAINLVIIGDSYATSVGHYPTTIKSVLGLDDSHFHKYALGGAGFLGAGQGKTFGDLLSDAVADTSYDHNGVTDVLVAGGCNDVSDDYATTAIDAAKNTFLNNARTAFPNATIHIAMIGGFNDKAKRSLLINRVMASYLNPSNSEKINTIMNGHLPMMLNSNFENDGIHPGTSEANKQIGFILATAIRSKSPYGSYSQHTFGSLTAKSGYTIVTQNPRIYLTNRGTAWNVDLNRVIEVSGSFEMNYGTGGKFDLFDMTTFISAISLGAGDDIPLVTIPVMVQMYVMSTESYFEPATLEVYGSGNSISIGINVRFSTKNYTATTMRIHPFSCDVTF